MSGKNKDSHQQPFRHHFSGERQEFYQNSTLITLLEEWVKKIEEIPIATEKKRRNLIALDETVVKALLRLFSY